MDKKEKKERKKKPGSLPAPKVSESELLYKENEKMDEKINEGSYEIKDIPDYNKEYASEILNDLQKSEDLINQIKTNFFKEDDHRKIEILHDYSIVSGYKRMHEVLIFNYIKEYLLFIISKSYYLAEDKYGILVLQGGACVQHFSNARRITGDLDYKFYPLPQNLTKTTIELQYNFLKKNILPYISLIDVKEILTKRNLKSVIINEYSPESSSTKKTIEILSSYDLSFKCTFQESRGIIKIFLKVKASESVTYELSLVDISLYKHDDKSNKIIKDILSKLNITNKLLPETTKFKIFYSLKDIPPSKKNIDVILLSKNYLIEQIKNYISDCEHYEELKLNKLKEQQSITGDYVKSLSEFTKLYPTIKLNKEYTEQLKKELEPKYISEVDGVEIYDTIEFLGCKKARQQKEALENNTKKGDSGKRIKKTSTKRKYIFKSKRKIQSKSQRKIQRRSKRKIQSKSQRKIQRRSKRRSKKY